MYMSKTQIALKFTKRFLLRCILSRRESSCLSIPENNETWALRGQIPIIFPELTDTQTFSYML